MRTRLITLNVHKCESYRANGTAATISVELRVRSLIEYVNYNSNFVSCFLKLMVDWKLSITFLLVFENVEVIASCNLGVFFRVYMVCVRVRNIFLLILIPLNFIVMLPGLSWDDGPENKVLRLVRNKMSLFLVVNYGNISSLATLTC